MTSDAVLRKILHMVGGQLFEDEDPLDGLDLKYLQDPVEEDFRPHRMVGNRIYTQEQLLCSAGCGRPAYIAPNRHGNRTVKRRTCRAPECIAHATVQNNARRAGRRKGSESRADFGKPLPPDTPFQETEITEDEVTRIIDEADRRTWGL